MSRRLLALLCLLLPSCAQATQLRIAYPAEYGDDVFIKTLLGAKVLSDAGLTVAVQKSGGEAEAMGAVRTAERISASSLSPTRTCAS